MTLLQGDLNDTLESTELNISCTQGCLWRKLKVLQVNGEVKGSFQCTGSVLGKGAR